MKLKMRRLYDGRWHLATKSSFELSMFRKPHNKKTARHIKIVIHRRNFQHPKWRLDHALMTSGTGEELEGNPLEELLGEVDGEGSCVEDKRLDLNIGD